MRGRGSARRPPGWYPDEPSRRRFRLWDGARWHRLTSSEPVWGPVDPEPGQPGAALGRAMSPVAIAASVLLVAALLGGGIWASIRGEDGDQAAPTDGAEVAGLTVEPTPDGSGSGAAPGDGTPPTTGPPPTGAAVQDCPHLEDELTTAIRGNAGIGSVAGTVTLTSVRCSASWASGEAVSEVTPTSLAVFERQGGAWVLVGYGATGVCNQLGLDPALAEALACN